MDPIFFALKGGFGVSLSDFDWGPGVPVINLEGVPGSKVPHHRVPVPLLHHGSFDGAAQKIFLLHLLCKIRVCNFVCGLNSTKV